MKILPNGIAILEWDQWISKWIQEQGKLAFDFMEEEHIWPWLRPGDVVVDAGAYIGSCAAGMWERIQPDGQLFAFEPNPEAFEALKHNVPKARLYNCALGKETGTARLTLDPKNGGASRLSGGIASDRVVRTGVLPLDDLGLPQLNFIKLDVEGSEPDVISGALETIKRCRPVLFIEFNRGTLKRFGYTYEDITKQLLPLDYRPKFLKPTDRLDMEAFPQLDAFMVPSELM